MINLLQDHVGEWLICDWIELIETLDINEEPYHTDVPLPLLFEQFIDENGVRFPMPGMQAKGQQLAISTSIEYNMKPGDNMRFYTPDGNFKDYEIVNVAPIQSKETMKSFQTPGINDLYDRKLVTF